MSNRLDGALSFFHEKPQLEESAWKSLQVIKEHGIRATRTLIFQFWKEGTGPENPETYVDEEESIERGASDKIVAAIIKQRKYYMEKVLKWGESADEKIKYDIESMIRVPSFFLVSTGFED